MEKSSEARKIRSIWDVGVVEIEVYYPEVSPIAQLTTPSFSIM